MTGIKIVAKVKKIIASYHHSFAGGSKNTSRLLNYLTQSGYEIDAYFFGTPQYFSYTKTSINIQSLRLTQNHSEVIDSSFIMNYLAADKIVQRFKKSESILFGANLFPYCDILLDAKIQIQQSLQSEPKLIVHPVGSDIWQIGRQLKSRVKWLLDHESVNSVITYSEKFALEIKEQFDIKREINVLPPVFESEKFFPLNELEISNRRKKLGLNDDVIILTHHSSMRKIKCPEIVIKIAQKASQLITSKCVLIMIGPIPFEKISSLNLNLEKICINEIFLHQTRINNLTIYWTGLLSNVEYLLQISNVELNTSLHDSFNLALMEAMGCAVPVVTSNTAGISEHVKKSNGGICFPVKRLAFDDLNNILNSNKSTEYLFEIDYAVSAVEDIVKNKEIAKLKAKEASAYVAREFHFRKIIEEFYKHIN